MPAARALRAAVAEEASATLARLGEPTPKEKRKTKRLAARFSQRVDRDGLNAAIEWATKKLGDPPAAKRYVDHYASNLAASPAAEAVRPAPAPDYAPAGDESPAPSKARRRALPAGLVGYLDPRLIDEDDWED